MNTHDKIVLPPLPEWADTTLQGEDRDSLFAWVEAAIEADRKRRGEPVAKVRDRGFEVVDGKHVPTVLVEFPVDDWESRDRFAAAVDAPQPADPDVLPGEAVFGFSAWLTSLKTPVTFSECHGAAIGADLAVAYNKSQGFDEIREGFHKRLKPFPEQEPTQPAEPVKVPSDEVKQHTYGAQPSVPTPEEEDEWKRIEKKQ